MFLAFSTAYGYVVQFKIFSLSVGFGLFHGLVFLPVILDLLGGSISKEVSLEVAVKRIVCLTGHESKESKSID